jgi:malate dehydrogenase (oxaloacetate-decarboxylating)
MPRLRPSASFSVTIRTENPHTPGMVGRISSTIGEAGGLIGAIDVVDVNKDRTVRDFVVAAAAQPVMEGKCLIFKAFAGVDAFPLCLATQDTDEIVETVRRIAPVFGGINLEDIAAPRCFEVEDRLRRELDIPVMHDDQHGTAIVVLAALKNALIVVGKSIREAKIVIAGAGAAGNAVARMLSAAGAAQIVLTDRAGVLSHDRIEHMDPYKRALAEATNPLNERGQPG